MSAFLRVAAWIIALSLVALPVVAVLQGWIGADRWPLRTLRVAGQLERVDEQKLREAVLPYARKGFFAIRLDQAQAAVDKLPWVDHAEVRKHWPDVVEVRIVEHRPFARWGDDKLLSEDGDLFPVADAEVPASLPRFDVDAPAARTADVVELYNEASRMFAPEGMRVREVSLDRRGSWSLLLSNDTRVVIGSQEARLRLARFARLMPNLLARNPQRLARADLRYTNGFALTWGEEPGMGNGESGTGVALLHPRTTRSRSSGAVVPASGAVIPSPLSVIQSPLSGIPGLLPVTPSLLPVIPSLLPVIPSAARDLLLPARPNREARSLAALGMTDNGLWVTDNGLGMTALRDERAVHVRSAESPIPHPPFPIPGLQT